MLIHIGNNAKPGLNLIRDILHQLFDILHTDNITGIINTDVKWCRPVHWQIRKDTSGIHPARTPYIRCFDFLP